MFEALQDRLRGVFEKLTSRGKLSEDDVKAALELAQKELAAEGDAGAAERKRDAFKLLVRQNEQLGRAHDLLTQAMADAQTLAQAARYANAKPEDLAKALEGYS